jgi:hypothetical protein
MAAMPNMNSNVRSVFNTPVIQPVRVWFPTASDGCCNLDRNGIVSDLMLVESFR